MGAVSRHAELVSASIARSARRYRRQSQSDRKIVPIGVGVLDQIDLPLPVPSFELSFTKDRAFHVAEQFVADEAMDAITASEAFDCSIAMLPDPADQIAGDTDVECPVRVAGKNIDARLALLSHGAEDAARWMLKQVQHDKFV